MFSRLIARLYCFCSLAIRRGTQDLYLSSTKMMIPYTIYVMFLKSSPVRCKALPRPGCRTKSRQGRAFWTS